jgi:hypothetical protein
MNVGCSHFSWWKYLVYSFVCLGGFIPSSGLSQISDSARQNFEWFETLGYPDLRQARWAEIWTGSDSFTVSSDPERASLHAFVTAETETEFSIFGFGLSQTSLGKTDAQTPSSPRIGFEQRPFRAFVEKLLASHRTTNGDDIPRLSYWRLPLKSETFVMAYACWAKGETDLAGQLYAVAEAIPLRKSGREESKPMREALEIDLGHIEMWRSVLECGGRTFGWTFWDGLAPSLRPREELAAAFRRIEHHFPSSPHVDDAKEMAIRLERMVKEDREHPAIPPDAWEQLPLDKRIAELVWRLRDQNGHQFSQPGWCSVLGMSDEGDSPAHQLLKIGYPAVPALIEALTDRRLSRSVGFHRNFHYSHTVLTVGDCAQQILNRITGRSFYEPDSTSGYMTNEFKEELVQDKAREWWAEFERKGKKQMLIDSIASGTLPPGPLVQQLEAEAPDAVVGALILGADASTASGGRFLSSFVDELAKREGPEPVHFLKEVLREHPDPRLRLSVAAHLLRLDPASALPAILAEWRRYPADGSVEEREGFSSVVKLLVRSGDAEALRALVADWETRSLIERFQIVKTFGEPDSSSGNFPFEVGGIEIRRDGSVSPESRTVAIELLVRALEDREVRQGYGGSRGDFEFKNPQVGDFALWALSRIDGEMFHFSPRAGRRLRDLQRIEAANSWRERQGLSLLPIPVAPGPALPEGEALKVVSVLLEPEGFKETPLAHRALELKGEDFGEKTLPDLLDAYLLDPVAETRGIAIEAYRRSDLTGVELTLRFEAGDTKEFATSTNWGILSSSTVGERRSDQVEQSVTATKGKAQDPWAVLRKAVREALASPPDTSFEFQAGVRPLNGLSVSF